MRPARLAALALLPALLSACMTTTTSTRTWGDSSGAGWERWGHVAQVRETVRRQEGNPGAGAVAGAIIGGVLGSAIGGRTVYDRWGNAYYQGNGAGAVAGAIGGAAIGAAASQGSSEERWYEVSVRFDDGGYETYVYAGPPPFRVGDAVRLTPQGLDRG
jgi:outer membrane lipoprotein SlyB